jgi:hypothetical protein
MTRPFRQQPAFSLTRTCTVLAYASLFFCALSFFSNLLHPRQMDFVNFWAAGELALSGHAAAAYDIASHKAIQESVAATGGIMAFLYPPPMLIFAAPMALLPYTLSVGLCVTGLFLLYMMTVVQIWPGSRWQAAAFPPAVVNGLVGQIGLMTGAIFLAASARLEKRPFLAGMIFGCLIIKPQLALLLPVAFLAGRQWRAFVGAACSVAALLIAAWLIFGWQPYLSMIEATPAYSAMVFDSPLASYKMTSVYAAARFWGASGSEAYALQLLAAAGAAFAVWRIWRGPHELSAKVAMLAAATPLVSPYLFLYDAVILISPFLWLAERRNATGGLVVLWLLMIFHIIQNWTAWPLANLMPLVPLALVAMIWRRLEPNVVASPVRISELPQPA